MSDLVKTQFHLSTASPSPPPLLYYRAGRCEAWWWVISPLTLLLGLIFLCLCLAEVGQVMQDGVLLLGYSFPGPSAKNRLSCELYMSGPMQLQRQASVVHCSHIRVRQWGSSETSSACPSASPEVPRLSAFQCLAICLLLWNDKGFSVVRVSVWEECILVETIDLLWRTNF